MKIKLNITQNELQALITSLRVQKQEITELVLFDAQNKETSLSTQELLMMFDQTENVYQQVLTYTSESQRKELKQRDIGYLNELHDIKENIMMKQY